MSAVDKAALAEPELRGNPVARDRNPTPRPDSGSARAVGRYLGVSALGTVVEGRYQGHPIRVTDRMFVALSLDRRRIIAASPSHARLRALIRAYRSGSRR